MATLKSAALPNARRRVLSLAAALVVSMVLAAYEPGTSGQGNASPSLPKIACADLTKLTFEGNTTVTVAAMVASGTLAIPGARGTQTLVDLPEFCRVQAVSRPTADSNIYFEVWLPARTWNRKFLSSGEGGYAGSLNYTRNGLDGGLDDYVRRGYATASTDTGHVASDRNWAIGHPEKVVDYAYRSKHLVTVASKGLISAFYGSGPDRSYFNSCSNGGRQGLMELQRYPADYDGVVVGAPWNYQSHSNAGFIWDAQALAAPRAAIAPAKLPAINAAVLAACDGRDGLVDGLIEDPRTCNFDPSVLQCRGAETDACLTAPQIDALKKLYAGPRNPRTGDRIYPGWAPGGELGWRSIVSSSDAGSGLGRTYFSNLVFENPNWDYHTFDFDSHMSFVEKKVGALADAIDPNLSTARKNGTKIIMYHGWNDQVLQPGNAPGYYESVIKAMGGAADTRDFFRLFMVPGMTHCYFGPGAGSFGGVGQQAPPSRDAAHDIQSAVEQWVEQGVAPELLVATKYSDDAAATKSIKMTRLLCPYPSVARYKQSGDPTDALSFVCVAPPPMR